MANCPNCKNHLPFFKVGTLSRIRNKMRCKQCNLILEGDNTLLAKTGGFGASSVLGIFYWAKLKFEENPFYVLFAVGGASLLFFLISTIQNNKMILIVANNQDEKLEDEIISEKINERPPMPKNATRIEYLKNRFYNKTENELIEISNSSEMTKEAQVAANELLKERNNVT